MNRFFCLLSGILLLAVTSIAQVTFRITQVPSYTPATARIYIAGSFNGWNPASASHELVRQPDSSYSITLPAGTGTIQFKFTRGSWATVEGNASGTQLPNRSFTYGNGSTVNLTIASWEDLHGGGGGGGGGTANAQVRILSDTFYMPQLNRNRRIWLYLPPNYDSSTARYPVIYMHDGQNLFNSATAFAGEWEIDETLSRLFAAGDPGAIVVGIDNGGASRINEYSPWVNAQYGGGQGDEYMDFIVQTLKPYVDSRYRTDTSRARTGLIGSSMGGLISQYGGIAHQQVFGRMGIFSPSLWFSNQVFSQISTTGKQYDQRYYILAGATESSTLVPLCNQLKSALEANGWAASDVQLVVKADGQHSEWFWRREFEAAYQWLFGINSSVAVNEPLSLKVYPNPATELLRIELPQQAASSYEIFDALGRKQSEGSLQPGDSITIAQLQAGWHLLRVKQNDSWYQSRFVKR
jgi:predicted alpha/beta superfamily hydrolase